MYERFFILNHISFAESDACVQGWINHVRYAATWELCGMCSTNRFLHMP